MFQFVVGSSGSGKTHFVYEQIINASLQHPEKQFFVLVPEQASLEAQKSLVKMHPEKGIMNIDALSFMRLSHRIFAETGRKPKLALDDAGKTLVVKRVLKERAGELSYFAGNAGRRGFCTEMKSVISELMQYGIDEDKLEEMQELLKNTPGSHRLLQKKLHDVAICYEGFKEFIADRFIAPEEIYDLLADAVYESSVLKGATIALDGYTGFTPSQYRLLSALLSTCEKVYITITMDASEADRIPDKHDLFYLSFKTMDRLRKIAEEAGCDEEPPILMPLSGNAGKAVNPRFSGSPAMAQFERILFSNSRKPGKDTTFDENAGCPVTIRSAHNPAAEVKALCCEINTALHEGVRYRDMAVITGAMDTYAPVIRREFEKAGIPAFLDFRRGIMSDPVVELLRALIYIPIYDFDRASVFRLLRCELFRFEESLADGLENYVVAYDIKGKNRWKGEWKRTWKRGHAHVLEEVNAARAELCERILPFVETLSHETTVAEKTAALREFLEKEQTEQRLSSLAEALSNEAAEALTGELKEKSATEKAKAEICAKNTSFVSEYAQILSHVKDIFDRMDGLMGEEVIPLKDFADLLELSFIETKVGLLPQSMDCMLVGDVERSRLGNIRRLFFIGVNEGVIPPAAAGSGIISDSDRSFFEDNGFELAPTLREKAYTGEFYLYQNLTKPSEKLYVSYSENDPSGNEILPSYLISTFKRMYDGLKPTPAATCVTPEYRLLSDNGRTAVLRVLRDIRANLLENGANLDKLKKDAELLSGAVELSKEEKDSVLGAVFYSSKEQKITEEAAKRIYGDFSASVSRLETFANCSLKHFLRYGLGLDVRREYEINPIDIGNMCHEIVELCGKTVIEEKRRFSQLSREECEELVENAANAVFANYENGLMHDSKRSEHIAELVKSACLRTVLTTVHQLEGGSFEPAMLEQDFSVVDGNLKLYGRIDRIDVCEDSDRVYVKVVDYKTGSTPHEVRDEEIAAGLELQLGIYVAAAKIFAKNMYKDKEFVPSAIFYYHVDDPVVDECPDPEQVINKKLIPNGKVNSAPEVLIRLDRGFEPDEGSKTALRGKYKPDSIPVYTKEDGSFEARSKVWTGERFEEVTEYLIGKAKEYVDGINAGEACANPVRMKSKSSCANCDFKDMCAFGALSGKRERILVKPDGTDDGDENGND